MIARSPYEHELPRKLKAVFERLMDCVTVGIAETPVLATSSIPAYRALIYFPDTRNTSHQPSETYQEVRSAKRKLL